MSEIKVFYFTFRGARPAFSIRLTCGNSGGSYESYLFRVFISPRQRREVLFSLRKHGRVSRVADCLLRDDTSCWHTTASYLRQYDRRAAYCVGYRIGNIDSRPSDSCLFIREKGTCKRETMEDKIFALPFGIREYFREIITYREKERHASQCDVVCGCGVRSLLPETARDA